MTESLTLDGNAAIVAEINISGMGRFSGKWHVKSSTHSVDTQSGYITITEIYKIQ